MTTRPRHSQPASQPQQEGYACLILRVWQEESGKLPAADWRSEVQHIQSGGQWTFASLADLEQFLSRWLHALARGEAVDPATE